LYIKDSTKSTGRADEEQIISGIGDEILPKEGCSASTDASAAAGPQLINGDDAHVAARADCVTLDESTVNKIRDAPGIDHIIIYLETEY
jgi:hypothetical protein